MTGWFGPSLQSRSAHLAGYARRSLERAAQLAGNLHAEEVAPEHWLAALLEDEDCAATRAVLHAFADPETIGIEVRALCSGIMVVGSGRSLPFSVGALGALGRARAGALARASDQVTTRDLFREAREALPEVLRQRLPARDQPIGDPPAARPFAAEEPYFRHFAPTALRALGAACRAAAALDRPTIGPAHLLLGCLDADEDLRTAEGISPGRLRLAIAGQDEDPTPLAARSMAGDARLHDLLERLPEGSQTLDVLAELLARGNEELIALLQRQKITPALVERCRVGFRDPEE